MIPQTVIDAMHLLIENYADNSQLTTSELYDRELLVEGYRDGIKDTLNCTDLLEKAGWIKREEMFAFIKWVTSEKSKYAVMYGDQEDRFADDEREYTVEQLYELYQQNNNNMYFENKHLEDILYQESITTSLLAQQAEVIRMMQPRIEKDGNQWVVIWGKMPEKYIAGYGDSIAKAVEDFCKQFHTCKP